MSVTRWFTAAAAIGLVAGALPLVAAASASAAPPPTVVTGGDLSSDGSSGWAAESLNGGIGAFVHGTGTPPLGTGSYWLKSNATGDKAFLHLTKVDGVALAGRPLTDLTGLSFASWASDGTFAPYVNIPVHSAFIDANKDGIADGDQPGVAGATGNAILVFDTASASGAWTTRDTFGSATWRLTRKLITPSTTVDLWTYKSLTDWETLAGDLTFASGYGDIQWVIGDTSTPAWGGREGWVDDIDVSTTTESAVYDLEEGLGPCPVSIDTVTQTLTMTGDCTTSQGLVLHDGWTLDGAGHTLTVGDPSSGSFTGAVLSNEPVTDATMNVRDLHLVGSLAAGCSGSLYGIRLSDAQGSISNVTIDGIRYGTGSGCQSGNSLDITNVGGATRLPVTVDDVTITNWQKTGLRANGNVALKLTDSSIASSNLDMVTASNSLQISRGARAYVSGNTIGGNDWDGDTQWSATGVLLYGADDVVFTRNVVSGSDTDFGMYVSQAAGYPDSHVTLTCNLFSRDPAADPNGPDVWNTGVAADPALLAMVSATGNTVTGFATPYANVADDDGGPCASGPVAGLTVTGGTAQVDVAWGAPTALPYAPVSGYRVTLVPGGDTQTVSGTTATFTGLSDDTTYTATVVPINAAGTGTPFSASGRTDAAPGTLPGAPQSLRATGGWRNLTATWQAPTSGAPLLSYTVTVSSGGHVVRTRTVAATGTSQKGAFRRLTPQRPYVVSVTATNGTGSGPASVTRLRASRIGGRAHYAVAHGHRTVVVNGRVTRAGGKRGITAAAVHVHVRISGHWHDLGVRGSTAAKGRYSVSFHPVRGMRWYVTATASGWMAARTAAQRLPG